MLKQRSWNSKCRKKGISSSKKQGADPPVSVGLLSASESSREELSDSALEG